MAALAIFIYDIMLSFGQEVTTRSASTSFHMLIHLTQVEYMWGSNTSLVTVLYFVIRYFTAINLVYVFLCRRMCALLNSQQHRDREYVHRIIMCRRLVITFLVVKTSTGLSTEVMFNEWPFHVLKPRQVYVPNSNTS